MNEQTNGNTMIYVFVCPKCKCSKELDMKVNEYERMKESLVFPSCKCGTMMNRVYTPGFLDSWQRG